MGAENPAKIEKINRDFISLSQAAKLLGCTPEHLNLIVRKNKIQAKKLGRNWYTTKEWVDAYLESVKRSRDAKKGIIKITKVTGEEIRKTNPEKSATISEAGKKSKPDELFAEKENAKEKNKHYFQSRNIFPVAALAAAVFLIFIIIPVLRYKIIQDRELDKIFKGVDSVSFFNEDEGTVLGEESDNERQFEREVVLASENYKAKQVRFGGESSVILEEDAPLEILDVRSETFLAKKQDESMLVISWRTNKLAICEIEYSKNNGQGTKNLKESGFGFNHGVVIPGLELGTAYVYQLTAKDKWGNIVRSGNFAVYSGSKAVSVVELIARELNEMFGWTRTK